MAPCRATITGLTRSPTARARSEILASISSSAKKGRVGDYTLEIEFLDPGVQAFDFTFG